MLRPVSGHQSAAGPAQGAEPLEWRIPMWNVAALVLLAAGMAGLNVFLSPGLGARIVTGLAGLAALTTAVVAYRMYLVVDPDGVGLRTARRTYSIDWPELADVGIVEKRVSTLRLVLMLADGTEIDIPQSLTAPGKPETRPVARAKLAEAGRSILDYPYKSSAGRPRS